MTNTKAGNPLLAEIKANMEHFNAAELLVIRTVLTKVTEGVYYGIVKPEEVLDESVKEDLTTMVNNGVITISMIGNNEAFIIELTSLDALLNLLASILPKAQGALQAKAPELKAKRDAHIQALVKHVQKMIKSEKARKTPIAIYAPNASNTATIKRPGNSQRIPAFAVTFNDLQRVLYEAGITDVYVSDMSGNRVALQDLMQVAAVTEKANGVYFYFVG